jgi:hypothetical protein
VGVPVVSGATVAGATLSCSRGTWTPDLLSSFDYRAPQSFAFGWSENAMTIAGTTTSLITAGSPGSYACQVTASNQSGSALQSSAAFTVNAAGGGGAGGGGGGTGRRWCWRRVGTGAGREQAKRFPFDLPGGGERSQ